MTRPDESLTHEALAGAILDLADNQRLVVSDIATEGITHFEIWRNPAGVPRCRYRATIPWAELMAELADTWGSAVDAGGFGALSPDIGVICVQSTPDGSLPGPALRWLREVTATRSRLIGGHGLRTGDVLRDVISRERLTRVYELMVLRPDESGGMEPTGIQLFRQGTRQGARVLHTVRIARESPAEGTAFVVVSRDGFDRYEEVSAESWILPSGEHTFEAELLRPGRVRFHGLPGSPGGTRPVLDALMQDMPMRVPSLAGRTAHLICAVEMSGPQEHVDERLRRTAQILHEVRNAPNTETSLISYRPHEYRRRHSDVPVQPVTWRKTPEQTLKQLHLLEERTGIEQGYPHAAAVECVLDTVHERLPEEPFHDLTALLFVGARPPHPARVNAEEVLPCPSRLDWSDLADALDARPGMRFAALLDKTSGSPGPAWGRLGSGTPYSAEAVDVAALIADLGLTADPLLRVPFPIEVP
ncbi:hypothetical protein EDD29_3807 [Actinocorallia herbida]|uniref:Uncharacterized protein n=1 Tax=Actinocorallia herbida TaxID=58109 RepID=A0A3N1CY92_9ACTN|nr:hypothetical protein [Actinocorallia herbida]ROO86244.1 hypothetical protein EDD29_3807 [Actinocorallia herbida]